MEAGAVEAVGADDAEGLARRTRLAVLVAPRVEQTLGGIGATGADELVAERVGNMRVGQCADVHFRQRLTAFSVMMIRMSFLMSEEMMQVLLLWADILTR